MSKDTQDNIWRAEAIAGRATELVARDRDRQHGSKLVTGSNIARFWTAYLRAKFSILLTLDAADIFNMLESMKIARRCHGEHNIDDYIDGAGYASCAGECQEDLDSLKEVSELREDKVVERVLRPQPGD